jgi:hypothetical protein
MIKAPMSERTYSVKLKNKGIKITSRELLAFRDMYVATPELAARMSELIWLDIYILDAASGVSSHCILSAIRDLEQGEPPFGVKPATQFKNMPLKGLWHKHFLSAQFLPQNILLGLGKTGLEKLVKEVMDPAKSTVFTRGICDELAHRVAHEPVAARNACCNAHYAGDQFIYDRIMENCVRDFPNLPTWLKAEQTSLESL